MEALLIRERYKVVRVLDARAGYAFVQAVDILDREQSAYLLNIYEGELLRAYLPGVSSMHNCPALRAMFIESDSLVTVFDECKGVPIDHVFYRGAKFDWRTRLDYAQLLMHRALSMADLPPEVSCAAMLSENVLISQDDREINMRFKVTPMEGMNGRELAYLACDQLKKILLPGPGSPKEQLDFLDELDGGVFPTVVPLYDLWIRRREQIRTACEELEKMNFIKRALKLLWGRIKRKVSKAR